MTTNLPLIPISELLLEIQINKQYAETIIDNILKDVLHKYNNKIKITNFIKKNYWNFKEKLEKKIMHPESETFQMFIEDKYF